jgi:long-subunit acyl-CoA synthetase (AMP-forming)
MSKIISAEEWVEHYAKDFPESIAMLGTSVARDMFKAIQRDALLMVRTIISMRRDKRTWNAYTYDEMLEELDKLAEGL